MASFRQSLWLALGGRRKIEAEAQRRTEEHKRLEAERMALEMQLRHAAAQDSDVLLIPSLIKMGVDVNAQDPETGRTALMIAVNYECRSVIALLLSHQVDIHIKANNGRSAVDIAHTK
ncbi:MAG: ankyrin repeat domain-containing protein, partial [Janthinobacterium lividum]